VGIRNSHMALNGSLQKDNFFYRTFDFLSGILWGRAECRTNAGQGVVGGL
jgi:hypothetical protein